MNKVLKSILWLVFDKVFILVLQFFIGIKVANYYGSEIYGNFNYFVAIVGFSSIFFELLNGRVIKKYYTEDNYNNVTNNVSLFRNGIAILLFIVSVFSKFFMKIDNVSYFILIFLALDNILITLTSGIENYYEYKLEVKKIVVINNLVKFTSYFLQYLGIILGYSIVMIPIVRCLGSLIRAIILKYFYKKSYGNEKFKLDKLLLKNIIKESFYLWASYIAFLVYTRLDKIMLGIMLGKSEVGIYSIGMQLSQILMIAVYPIQTSMFPKMMSLYRENYKKYLNFYFKSNLLLTQFYIFGIIFSIFTVKNLFLYVFSIEYIEAINIYAILSISVLLKANGAFQTSHMTLKEITKKSFYKTVFGAFLNIILNYIFIKKYGLVGAAIATSITHIFTLFIIDFFIKEYREQAFIQLKSFNTFYFIKLLKRKDL